MLVWCMWAVGRFILLCYIMEVLDKFSSELPPAVAGNRHSIIGIVINGGKGVINCLTHDIVTNFHCGKVHLHFSKIEFG